MKHYGITYASYDENGRLRLGEANVTGASADDVLAMARARPGVLAAWICYERVY